MKRICLLVFLVLVYFALSAYPAFAANISGTIYYDNNLSGTIDPGEELYYSPPRPFTSVRIVETGRSAPNINGTYTFTGIAPGTYTLRMVPNPPYKAVIAPGGGSDATVNVTSGDVTGVDFLVQAWPLRAQVFLDANGDGDKDASEPFISGVEIGGFLPGNNNPALFPENPQRACSQGFAFPTFNNAPSTADGYNYVLGAPSGSFTLRLSLPAGFIATTPTVQTVNIVSYGSESNFEPAFFGLQYSGGPISDPSCPIPTPTPTATPTPPTYTVSGTIYEDVTNSLLCETNEPYDNTSARAVVSYGGGNRSDNLGSNGNFTVTNIPAESNAVLSLQNLPATYRIVGLTNPGSPPVTYSSGVIRFALPPSRNNIGVCISQRRPWWQVTIGDVRMPLVYNQVYPNVNNKVTTEDAIFLSSRFDTIVTVMSPRNPKVIVNNEYSWNNKSAKRAGQLSYTYFKGIEGRSEVRPLEQAPSLCIDGIPCDIILDGSRTFYTFDGNLRIRSVTFGPNAVASAILVNGDVTVLAPQITVPSRSVFVVAAEGNMFIDFDPKTTSAGSEYWNTIQRLGGIYTAHGNITVVGNTCNVPLNDPSNPTWNGEFYPDNKLIIQGSLIANAEYPFSSTNPEDQASSYKGGRFIQNRSLCEKDTLDTAADPTDGPAVVIQTRPDLILQFPLEWKQKVSKWQELLP